MTSCFCCRFYCVIEEYYGTFYKYGNKNSNAGIKYLMQKFAFDLFWNQFRVMSLTILNFLSQMSINLKCINKNRKIFNETCEIKINDEPQIQIKYPNISEIKTFFHK